jgi:putative ABC transport system permease protein
MLIVSEIALALVLLVGAGLLTGSFLALLKVNPGFEPKQALAFTVSISPTRYTDQQQAARFFQGLTDKLKTLPGVQSVGAVSSLPLSGHSSGSAARVEGRQSPPGEQPTRIGWQTVSPDYFKTMGMQLLRGRDFSSDDLARPAHLTIINESLAQRIFPGEDPLGKRVTFGGMLGTQPDWHEIIGVVSDTRHLSLDDPPQPRAYDLFGQHGGRSMFVVARVAGDPTSLAGAVRAEVRQLDAEAPVWQMATLEELVARSAATRRFSMSLIGAFALIALALAAVGVYGVINHSVSQRTREIGIRMALGARPCDVIELIIGQSLRLTLIGVASGLAAALALTRLMRSLLFGVSATDPVTFVGVAGLLTFVALLACFVPARRATKVDPLAALKHE